MPTQVREALAAIDFSNFHEVSQASYQLDFIHAEKIKNQRNLHRYRNINNNYQSRIGCNKKTAQMSKVQNNNSDNCFGEFSDFEGILTLFSCFVSTNDLYGLFCKNKNFNLVSDIAQNNSSS